jgi:uncharacterized membrane protein
MEKIAEAVAILGVLAIISLIFVYWQLLPAIIPNHFNIEGQANGYGPKSDILFPAALGLVLYLAMTAAVVFRYQLMSILRVTDKLPEPKYAVIRAMLTWFKAEIVWACALMVAVLINAAMNYNYQLALIMPLPVIVIILTFLYYVAKLIKPGWVKIV